MVPEPPAPPTPWEALMAELPEVETIRRQLEREVVGRKVKSVEVFDTKAIPRHSSKKEFSGML